MPRVIDFSNNVLMQGKNLAVVLRYARKADVYRVRVDYSAEYREKYAVTFYFDDEAQCLTYWGDWRVLLDWLLARRSWNVDRVHFARPGMIDEATSYYATEKLRKRGTNVVGPQAPLSIDWSQHPDYINALVGRVGDTVVGEIEQTGHGGYRWSCTGATGFTGTETDAKTSVDIRANALRNVFGV